MQNSIIHIILPRTGDIKTDDLIAAAKIDLTAVACQIEANLPGITVAIHDGEDEFLFRRVVRDVEEITLQLQLQRSSPISVQESVLRPRS